MPPAVVAEALAKGPLGVPALAAVAGAVLAPLTLYRQGYSFSVGYGSAVGVMALAAMRAVPPTTQLATLTRFTSSAEGGYLDEFTRRAMRSGGAPPMPQA